jgi:hypothetical protein
MAPATGIRPSGTYTVAYNCILGRRLSLIQRDSMGCNMSEAIFGIGLVKLDN